LDHPNIVLLDFFEEDVVLHWGAVSDEAKDLIRGLLRVDSETRLTVDEVLTHVWVRLILINFLRFLFPPQFRCMHTATSTLTCVS
jgi:serine/threonine protein kinase